MITANLADGTKLNFPDGTDPSVVQRAVKAHIQGGNPQVPLPAGNPNPQPPDGFVLNPATGQMTSRELLANNLQPGAATSAGAGYMQGMSFGTSDEMMGGINALMPGKGTAGERYDFGREQMRAMLDKSRKDHPVAAYGGEIGGAILSPANKIGIMGAGARIGSKIVAGAASGATAGGLYGFGTGEGGLGDRATSAAENGLLGGVIGGAVAPVVAAGSKLMGLGSNVAASVKGTENQNQASKFVKTILDRSGKTEAQVTAEIQAAAADGQPMFTSADAMGKSGQGALSTMTRQPGEASQLATDFLNTRQEGMGYPLQGGQGSRVSDFIKKAMNAPDTAAQRAEAIAAERSTTSDAAYGAARANAGPVDVRGALDTIDQRIGGMQGSGVAGDGIDGQLSGFRARLANSDSTTQLSDFNRVLQVKRDVEDAASKAYRDGKGNLGAELKALKTQLDSALENSSKDYRFANDQHAKASRALDAVDAGKAAFSNTMRHPDVADQFGAASSQPPIPFGGSNIAQAGAQPYGTGLDAQSGFRSGYADRALATVESQAPGVNKARGILDSKNSNDFGLMASDPALLNRQLGREDTMFQTRARATGGSMTADNLANEADAGNLIKGAATTAFHAVTGNVMGLARQLGEKFTNLATGKNEKTRELIAKMLLSQNPQAALVPAIANAAKINARETAVSAAIRAAMRHPQEGIVNNFNRQ